MNFLETRQTYIIMYSVEFTSDNINSVGAWRLMDFQEPSHHQ